MHLYIYIYIYIYTHMHMHMHMQFRGASGSAASRSFRIPSTSEVQEKIMEIKLGLKSSDKLWKIKIAAVSGGGCDGIPW